MEVIESLQALRTSVATLDRPIGFVPTMGYLHEGHLSLVRKAKEECSSVVVSIFVNPTQFGENEDLEAYPRNLSRDIELLSKEGVNLLWTPTTERLYPPNFQTWVDVEKLTQHLEGAMRPGHFRGVTTIVCKLFNAVKPQKAYFGQKDAQQARVIQQMTKDLNFDIDIVVCPIVREPDGLAMSSRNSYLNPQERKAATVLSRALFQARQAYLDGERRAQKLRDIMLQVLHSEPLANVQYVSCADIKNLEEISDTIENAALLSMAVYIGSTRLIDNVILSQGDEH